MSSHPPNIIEFQALAASVLGALFDVFPVPIDLSANNFSKRDPDALIDTAFKEEAHDLFEHTVKWLGEERYLKFKMGPGTQTYNPTFSMCQLTERGLATLTRPLPELESKDGKTTIGSRLLAVTKNVASKGAGGLAMEAGKLELSHVFGLIFT